MFGINWHWAPTVQGEARRPVCWVTAGLSSRLFHGQYVFKAQWRLVDAQLDSRDHSGRPMRPDKVVDDQMGIQSSLEVCLPFIPSEPKPALSLVPGKAILLDEEWDIRENWAEVLCLTGPLAAYFSRLGTGCWNTSIGGAL